MWWSRALAATALCAALAGCGFQLRGQASLPFDTLYMPGASPLVVELKRNVVAGTHSKLVNSEKDAKAILGFTHEVREKVILSFNTSGLVREYQLRRLPAVRREGAQLPAAERDPAHPGRFLQRSAGAGQGNGGRAAVPRYADGHGAADHPAHRRGEGAHRRMTHTDE